MIQDDSNQDSLNKEEQIAPGWGDDLYFPRGLFKTNGVWRDRASTLDHLDSISDLCRLEDLLFMPLISTSNLEELPFDIDIKSDVSILVKLTQYRKSHPAEEYKTLDVAKSIWPETSNVNRLFAYMYRIFKTYPVFNRSRSGHFSFKLTNKEMYTMLASRKREKALRFKRVMHRSSKREISIETIRRYARTPGITAKELSVKCEIAVPTAAAYIAHANRTVKSEKTTKSEKTVLVLNVNGSTETLKAFHAELLTQQENGKFQGLKFSLKKV